jgi:hypothetical protein
MTGLAVLGPILPPPGSDEQMFGAKYQIPQGANATTERSNPATGLMAPVGRSGKNREKSGMKRLVLTTALVIAAIVPATASVGPPGAYGTITGTGRDG